MLRTIVTLHVVEGVTGQLYVTCFLHSSNTAGNNMDNMVEWRLENVIQLREKSYITFAFNIAYLCKQQEKLKYILMKIQ